MGEDVKVFSSGGSRPPDSWGILQLISASDPPVRLRFMDDVSSGWDYPGRFPSQGIPPSVKDSAIHGRDRQVYLPISGCGNEGSGAGGGGYVRPQTPEYQRPVYRYSSNTRDMSGIRSMAGGAVVDDMVVVGRTWLEEGAYWDRD